MEKLPTEAIGIHQSDLIIRSALISALDDIRLSPWLLDYVFASLPKDSLTASEYGQREVDNAKKWFLSTKIPVFMSTRIDDPALPGISITLVESSEAEQTLADLHYVEHQDDDRLWPALTDLFTPVEYNPTTGVMKLPDSITLVVVVGMQVLDRSGRAHAVVEVGDSDGTIKIEPCLQADFRDAVIKGQRPTGLIHFESVKMKETYAIGCHVQGEQVFLTYLHTLIVFALLRYKASLLEARGFERSTISSSDFRRNDAFENELTFSRHINITGYVTQVWPAATSQKATTVDIRSIKVIGAGVSPSDVDPSDSLWTGDQDALTVSTGQ